ncbi:MAG: hypothetical protein ACK5MQ_17005 [Pikeienuella sp.]
MSRRAAAVLDVLAMVLLGLVVALALLPFFTAPDPLLVNIRERLLQPGETPGHVLGADILGRDSYARFGMALRLHLLLSAGFVAVAVAGALLLRRTRLASMRINWLLRWALIVALAAGAVLGAMFALSILAALGVVGPGLGGAFFVMTPPALVAALALATSPNRVATAALAFAASAVLAYFYALAGFGPPPPLAVLSELVAEHSPLRPEIARLSGLAFAMAIAAAAAAGVLIGRRLP